MGTTLDALNSDAGVAVTTVVAIEGYDKILTDGDPAAVLNTWNGSGSPYSEWSTVLGGLKVHFEQRAKVDPWSPMQDPSILTLRVVPDIDSNGDVVDTFGEDVGKRTAQFETRLVTNLNCTGTTVAVQRTDDFPSSGDICLGPETMQYTSHDTSADTFAVVARGRYSPFTTESGGLFARTHKTINLATQTGDPLGVITRPVVSSSPLTWIGRWVGVWLHRRVGSTLDSATEAHLAFAGTIADVGEDEEGATVITLESVERRIYESVLMRDPFRAQIKEGIYLTTGQAFHCSNERTVAGTMTSATANPLTVVPSPTASGANQINDGVYTVYEIADRINRWLQAEKAAGRLLFNCRYTAAKQVGSGLRPNLAYDDPTTTSNVSRRLFFTFPSQYVAEFMGWDDDQITSQQGSPTYSKTGTRAPLRIQFGSHASPDLHFMFLENQRGTWCTQGAILPAALRDPDGLIDGILKIGDLGYVRVSMGVGSTAVRYTRWGMSGYFPAAEIDALRYTVEDEASLEVQQVIIAGGPFNELLPRFLLSTGTGSFNSTLDTLAESLGCAIPYSLLGDDFMAELDGLANSDKILCAIIDKPTPLSELLESELLARGYFFRWGRGRLGMGGWSTPTTSLATIVLDEDNKEVPSAMADSDQQRSSKQEDDGSLYNTVTFKYGRQLDGSYTDTLTIIDATSVRDHGARLRTVEMRNTSGPANGPAVTDIRSVLNDFSAIMPLFSRPFWRIRRTLARSHFEQALPGTVALLTDRYLRSPETGLRYNPGTGSGGVLAHPVLVIGSEFDWGGPGRDTGGEVELMLLPRSSTAAYCPCAQVDDTATGSGYDDPSKTLTFYEHKHSQSSDDADLAHFAVGNKVRIVEMDPDDPASPLSWDDEIADIPSTTTVELVTGLSGFDTSKRYRMTPRGYLDASGHTDKCFQADDADGLIADSRQAFQLIASTSRQAPDFESADPTDPPARHADSAYGDGEPLDTGYERDIADLANNLVHYKHKMMAPRPYGVARSYSSGTWTLVEVIPICVGRQAFQVWQTCRLYVSPAIRSTSGATAECRITLASFMPTGSTAIDISRTAPYVEQTFTTTSTSFVIPSEEGLDIRHLPLSSSGVGFLYVEVNSVAEYKGLARRFLGPVETP